MADWIKKPDGEFAGQMGVTVPALVATPEDFGLVAADVATLGALRTAFEDKLAALAVAKAAVATATAEKDAARGALEATLRPLVQRAQASPVTTDDNRRLAGIPVRDNVRTSSAPIPPSQLVAAAEGSSGALISWNSNGNASGILYVLEKRVNNVGEWLLVNVLAPTKFRITGLAPGVRVDFRVRARRGQVDSEPSNVATINA